MERQQLKIELRDGGLGKNASRRLRVINKIPAIIYGPHFPNPIPLAVDYKEFTRATKAGKNPLFTLVAEGKGDVDGKTVLVREKQIHPVTGRYVHLDFYEIRMDQEITVHVPIALVGKAKGVAEGGILQQIQRELEIRCLPNQIPDKIEVNVTELNIGDSIHLDELTLPAGTKPAEDVNYTIAAVVPPTEEEVAPTPAEAAAALGEGPAEGVEGEAAAPAAEGAEGEKAAAEGAPEKGAPAAGKDKPDSKK